MRLALAQGRGKNTERWKNESGSHHLQKRENEGRVLSSEAVYLFKIFHNEKFLKSIKKVTNAIAD